MSRTQLPIRLVIFDWAGTTIDYGCFAPVAAFVRLFADRGVSVTEAQARVPMGLGKRDHIVAMLKDPATAAAWKKAVGKDWTDTDVDQMYYDFAPIQMEVLGGHAKLVPGLLPVIAELRHRGIKIGGTTGYFRDAANAVAEAAAQQGFKPDFSANVDDVTVGRPAPWMVYRNMETTCVYPPSTVVKVGDTVPDIEEGLNAGVWSIGVTASGSEVGLSYDALTRLSAAERQDRLDVARRKLLNAGAHEVIDSLDELPALIERLNARTAEALEVNAVGV